MGLSNMKHCAYVCFETKKPFLELNVERQSVDESANELRTLNASIFFNIPFWTDWANQPNKF